MAILTLKSAVTARNNLLEVLNSRFELGKYRISKLELDE